LRALQQIPITVRRSIELAGLFFLGSIIYIGAGILTPLLMAFFIAIVLLPVNRFFRKRKFPEVLSIALSVLLLLLLVAGLVWFFSSQVSILIDDFPQIKQNVTKHLQTLSEWISRTFNMSTKRQSAMVTEKSSNLMNMAGNVLGGAAGSVSSIFVFVGLLPIYIFLILYYKNLLMRFVFLWFPEHSHEQLKDVIHETESIIKSYLGGLLIQITYITILLGGILMIFGIEHALLIGVIFAILNLIPYVGALIGNIIGVLLTLTSSETVTPIFIVLGTIAFVQFLDNNILMPRIVGSKVKINALATIVGVIIGGAMAGISGMFLSLPLIAVMKIIFDRTDNFRQWGVLLGDERPKVSPIQFAIFRKKTKAVRKELERQNNVEQSDSSGDQKTIQQP
jgi:predicted PurR-regulated permease PerM